MPEIVGIKNVPYAVSLYSVANNGARVLGPGIAGVLIPIIGGAAVIGVNAATYVFLLAVLIWWRRTPQAADTTGESFLSAMRTGFRFVRQSDRFRTVMLRGGLFFSVTSIILAMMPMLVPNSADYGLVFGCFGMGAITGALNYGRLSSMRLCWHSSRPRKILWQWALFCCAPVQHGFLLCRPSKFPRN